VGAIELLEVGNGTLLRAPNPRTLVPPHPATIGGAPVIEPYVEVRADGQ
jgi:hypothetical protein